MNYSELSAEQLEAVLLATGYRRTCPDSQQLGAYHLALLSATEQAQIAKHLQTCPHCQAELAELVTFLAADDLPSIPTTSKTWQNGSGYRWQVDEQGGVFLQLMSNALRQFLTFDPTSQLTYAGAPSGRRGSSAGVSFAWQDAAGEVAVHLTAQPERGDASRCRLQVAVAIASLGGWPNLAEIAVTLQRDGTIIEEAFTDAYGRVDFSGLRWDGLPDITVHVDPVAA